MGTVTPAELELQTMVDRQITEGMRDAVRDQPAAQAARGSGASGTLKNNVVSGGAESLEVAGALPYRKLSARHPEYLADYWRECRALYAGGPRLFLDDQVHKRLFPSHAFEAPDVYSERRSRSFYVSYAGEIIDNLLAGFAADPMRFTAGNDENGDEVELPEWWSEFAKDVSPPGGETMPVGTLAVEWLREAFQTRTAWALVDMPRRDPNAPPPESRLEEEEQGLNDPYVCLLPSENVVDWEEDEDTHELQWVLCHWRSRRRESLQSERTLITERWLLWTPERWARYRCMWHPLRPPQPDDPIALEDEGTHDFGQVPIVRFVLPEGMYAMGKMHSPAREHFNKRNAVAWAEYKSLFAVLFEFLGGATGEFNPAMSPAVADAAVDPNRAVNQTFGQGYSQIRNKDDKAEYVGPPTDAFETARASCTELMREIHRVMFSMALSADMGAAALKRSGESKEQDAVSIAVILAKCGELLRDGLGRIRDLVARARGTEAEAKKVEPTGGVKFDAQSVAAAITEAVEFLNGVPQKSPTFTKRYLYRLYKLAASGDLSPEDLELIREELETAVTAESLMLTDPNMPPPNQMVPPGEEDDPEDEDEPAPKPGRRRLYP